MTGNSIVADTNQINKVAIQESKLLTIDATTAEIFVTIKLALFAKGNPIPEMIYG